MSNGEGLWQYFNVLSDVDIDHRDKYESWLSFHAEFRSWVIVT